MIIEAAYPYQVTACYVCMCTFVLIAEWGKVAGKELILIGIVCVCGHFPIVVAFLSKFCFVSSQLSLSLLLSSLPLEILREYFGEYGTLTEVNLKQDQYTQRSRYFTI